MARKEGSVILGRKTRERAKPEYQDTFETVLAFVCTNYRFIKERADQQQLVELTRMIRSGARLSKPVKRAERAEQLRVFVEALTGRRIQRRRNAEDFQGYGLISYRRQGMSGPTPDVVAYACPGEGGARCASVRVIEPGAADIPHCPLNMAEYCPVETR